MSNPKKYRLLKDLPDLKAGAIFEYDNQCYQHLYCGDNWQYLAQDVEDNPEWFEPADTCRVVTVEDVSTRTCGIRSGEYMFEVFITGSGWRGKFTKELLQKFLDEQQ